MQQNCQRPREQGKEVCYIDDVIKRAIEVFQGKFDYFVKNINKMDVLFGSSFAKLQDVGMPFTRCGVS
eukprot:scaffold139385_cov33-Attheya_sp.AAC.1